MSSDEKYSAKKHKAAVCPCPLKQGTDREDIQETIDSVNDLLHQDKLSQKQTWQIGKRLKKVIDENPDMEKSQMMDALFLWGTALARLASQHDDVELANAAIDKFEEIDRISNKEANALGAVGYTLWGSCLLVLAKEQQDNTLFSKAFEALDKATELDDGNKFETNLHHAKALVEVGDFMRYPAHEQYLINEKPSSEAECYYKRALLRCENLERLYQTQVRVGASTYENSDDEDIITEEDYAQVELLRAKLYASIYDIDSASFEKVYRQYKTAQDLDPRSDVILLEWIRFIFYVLTWGCWFPSVERMDTIIQEVDGMTQNFLLSNGFDINAYQDLLESETANDSVPHLLHLLGELIVSSLVKQPRIQKIAGKIYFDRAQKYLFVAHQFDERLGCYGLARLYATPAFCDETKCLQWLETAESYGILEDRELELDFQHIKKNDWFQSFLGSIQNGNNRSPNKSGC